MERRHRDAIRHNFTYIISHISPVELLPELGCILTESCVQQIRCEETQRGARRAATLLVDDIQRKGPTAFIVFLQALWAHKCNHVVNKILCSGLDESERDNILQQLTKCEDHVSSSAKSFHPTDVSVKQNDLDQTSRLYHSHVLRNVLGNISVDQEALLEDLPYKFMKHLIHSLNKMSANEKERLQNNTHPDITYKQRKQLDVGRLFGEVFLDILIEKKFNLRSFLTVVIKSGLISKILQDLNISGYTVLGIEELDLQIAPLPTSNPVFEDDLISIEDNAAICATENILPGQKHQGKSKIWNHPEGNVNKMKPTGTGARSVEMRINPDETSSPPPVYFADKDSHQSSDVSTMQPTDDLDGVNSQQNAEMKARDLAAKQREIENDNVHNTTDRMKELNIQDNDINMDDDSSRACEVEMLGSRTIHACDPSTVRLCDSVTVEKLQE